MALLLLNLADCYCGNAAAANGRNGGEPERGVSDGLDWWQTAVFYQIYPRSFKDSTGKGVGDIKGIEEKAQHFKDLGVDCIWLSPIFKSPMADFGYDISDYNQIDSIFGTINDFISLQKKLVSLGIKIILDFVPNHSSDEHVWFKKSVEKIDPYTDYYVWKNAKYDENKTRVPPSNWQSLFGNSAWTWNEKRGQYYLHQFDPKQPDLNYRSNELVNEMKNNLRFWLNHGVDGYRIDAVPFLFENSELLDEPRKPEEVASKMLNSYNQYDHNYTMDLPETYDMICQFREVFDEYKRKDGKTRVMIVEAYTTLENTMKYYGNKTKPGAHMPFNFILTNLNDQSKAVDFNDSVLKWLDNMPEGKWANWVIGNHDLNRVAARFGADMVDAMNALTLLLPGTAITYMGEEIGMENTNVRWDQTVDPMGRNAGPDGYRELSRDPARTPYQWDASVSAGFSSNSRPWLPVNPGYWQLNLDAQRRQRRSHYHVYKRLVELRKTPALRRGAFAGHVLSDWVYAFSRSLLGSETYLVVINVGSYDEYVDISALAEVKDNVLYVHTSGINSEHDQGTRLKTSGFTMRPKSVLVLSEKRDDVIANEFDTVGVTSRMSSSSSLIYPSAMSLVALGFILANRYGILTF